MDFSMFDKTFTKNGRTIGVFVNGRTFDAVAYGEELEMVALGATLRTEGWKTTITAMVDSNGQPMWQMSASR